MFAAALMAAAARDDSRGGTGRPRADARCRPARAGDGACGEVLLSIIELLFSIIELLLSIIVLLLSIIELLLSSIELLLGHADKCCCIAE